MEILNKMEKKLNDDNENPNKDIEYLFVQAAAADIRTLSETERCMTKLEINNSIFKHQMKNSETTLLQIQL